MRRLLVALIATTVLSPVVSVKSALAADMPVKAPVPKAAKLPYDWSGLYLGGHIGYMWGRTRVEEDGVVTEPNAATNGTVGGVLLGYNWQSGPVVFGLEGDFGWTNAHGTGTVAPPPPIVVTTQAPNTYDVNWTSHIRGRAGYAFDNWLFFMVVLPSPILIFTRVQPRPRPSWVRNTPGGQLVAAPKWHSRVISSAVSSIYMTTLATRITPA